MPESHHNLIQKSKTFEDLAKTHRQYAITKLGQERYLPETIETNIKIAEDLNRPLAVKALVRRLTLYYLRYKQPWKAYTLMQKHNLPENIKNLIHTACIKDMVDNKEFDKLKAFVREKGLQDFAFEIYRSEFEKLIDPLYQNGRLFAYELAEALGILERVKPIAEKHIEITLNKYLHGDRNGEYNLRSANLIAKTFGIDPNPIVLKVIIDYINNELQFWGKSNFTSKKIFEDDLLVNGPSDSLFGGQKYIPNFNKEEIKLLAQEEIEKIRKQDPANYLKNPLVIKLKEIFGIG